MNKKKITIIILAGLTLNFISCNKEEDYKNKIKPHINFLDKPINTNK